MNSYVESHQEGGKADCNFPFVLIKRRIGGGESPHGRNERGFFWWI